MSENIWIYILLFVIFFQFLCLAYYNRLASKNWQSWYQCEVELMRKSDKSGKIKLVVK